MIGTKVRVLYAKTPFPLRQPQQEDDFQFSPSLSLSLVCRLVCQPNKLLQPSGLSHGRTRYGTPHNLSLTAILVPWNQHHEFNTAMVLKTMMVIIVKPACLPYLSFRFHGYGRFPGSTNNVCICIRWAIDSDTWTPFLFPSSHSTSFSLQKAE